jgi:hypothetical protein
LLSKYFNNDPRSAIMSILSTSAACYLLTSFLVVPADAGVDLVASKSLTVQSNGPRSGDAGSKYFNIQGKGNERYASFGVLIFEVPQAVQDKKVKSMKLTLVESIPQFAKDGAIQFFVAPATEDPTALKFDLNAADGVGSQIKLLHPVGKGEFKKIETGKTDSFALTVDDAVQKRIIKGGKLCLVIVPADAAVAATYFGANEDAKENSPRLTLELP